MSLTDKITQKMMPLATAICENKHLTSLRDGFMVAFPATMFASIMMIIQNLPATFGFDKFLPDGFITFLNDFSGPIGNATMNVTALFVTFGVGYYFANYLKCSRIYAGAVSLSSFLLLLPFKTEKGQVYMPTAKLGSQGMIVAILTGFLATVIFAYPENKKITIKMPKQVPPGIATSFTSIIPSAASLLIFNTVRYLFTFTSWGNAFDCLFNVLQQSLVGLGTSLPATLVAVVAAQLLCWFGVHGQMIVGAITEPLLQTSNLENYAAFQAGKSLPHIICSTFMRIFPLIGGNGMTLGVVLV